MPAEIVGGRPIEARNAPVETYPPEYLGPRPIEEQIEDLARKLYLNPKDALEFVGRGLPSFETFVPPKALPWVGWFAVASAEALASNSLAEMYDPAQNYCSAVRLGQEAIAKTRRFYSYKEALRKPSNLRVCDRTIVANEKIAKKQKGDIHIIAAQLGAFHVGTSIDMTRTILRPHEFGLTSFAVECIAITHPERLVRWEELGMQCVGDELRLDDKDPWSQTPVIYFHDEKVNFNTVPNSTPYTCYGAVTGFLPPEQELTGLV